MASSPTSHSSPSADPGNRQARLDLAQQLTEAATQVVGSTDSRKISAAIDQLAHATELDPYCFRAWLGLAQLYHQVNNARSANECYLQALRLIPDHSNALGHHGMLLLELYQVDREQDDLLERALERFEAAHHCDPDNIFALFGLIDVHLECVVPEMAQRLSRLLQQVPPEPALTSHIVVRFLKFARELRKHGQNSLTLLQSLARKLLEIWRPLKDRYRELSWIEAIAEILTAEVTALPEVYGRWRQRVSPGNLLFNFVHDRLSEINRNNKRLQISEQFREQRPNDPFIRQEYLSLLHLQAKQLLALDQFEDAEALWKQCLTQDFYNDRLRQNVALMALASGDQAEIRASWEKLTRIWIAKAELFPDQSTDFYELIGLKEKIFSDRRFELLKRGVVTPDRVVVTVEDWIASSIRSVILRGLAIGYSEFDAFRFFVEEDLPGFLRMSLRSLLEICNTSLIAAPELPPPFHYDVLGIEKTAPTSELREVTERLLLESASQQNADVQDAISVISDRRERRDYDNTTLDWDVHLIRREISQWLPRLNRILSLYPSKELVFLVQLIVFSLDFSQLKIYYDFSEAGRYVELRDNLMSNFCREVMNVRFQDPGKALEILSEISGSLDRWQEANDCCTLAKFFNECELIYFGRNRARSSVNGLAKGIYLLKRAEQIATDIETRARILQQLAEIETQEPGDMITTPSDGDPDIKQKLSMALNDIRTRNYDQARQRLESILKKRPNEVGAVVMIGKITMEEALLAYGMTKDLEFLEAQLGEVLEMLKPITEIESLPPEIKGPCRRMVWQVNGNLDKARQDAAKQNSANAKNGVRPQ